MILRIVELRVVGPHHLALAFNDGTRKTVDVSPLLSGPIFEALKNPKFFALAFRDVATGAVIWPNGGRPRA